MLTNRIPVLNDPQLTIQELIDDLLQRSMRQLTTIDIGTKQITRITRIKDHTR